MIHFYDGPQSDRELFKIYAADDHFLLIDSMMSAGSNRHKFLHILIPLEDCTVNALRIVVNGNAVACGAIIVNSDISHEFNGKNAKHALLLIDHTSHLGRCIAHSLLQGDAPYHILPAATFAAMRGQLAALADLTPAPLEYQKRWGRFLALLGLDHCSLPHAPGDERVMKVLEYIRRSKKFSHTMESLAEQVYLSPSRLSHLFTRHTGGTLKNYLLFTQLLHALSLIAQGESATAAALGAGFDTPSHLSSTCRRLMGLQPNLMGKVSCFLKVSLFH